MNLVVTGGFGFIGSHFLTCFNKDFVKSIKVVARSISKADEKLLNELPYQTECVKEDLSATNYNFLDNCDYLIHLAWASNPAITGDSYAIEKTINIDPTSRLIAAAKNKGVKKFIFISSGGTVYGNTDHLPIEEDHPKNPVSAYGKAKLEVENLIIQSGIEYVILRPANAYGPGIDLEKGQGVIGHWVDRIQMNQPVSMIGDGSQIRDFIHVTDVANAIGESLRLSNMILNVGSETGTQLKELVDKLDALVGRKTTIETTDFRQFDVRQNVLSTRLIRSVTNWKPVILLDDGLEALIK